MAEGDLFIDASFVKLVITSEKDKLTITFFCSTRHQPQLVLRNTLILFLLVTQTGRNKRVTSFGKKLICKANDPGPASFFFYARFYDGVGEFGWIE